MIWQDNSLPETPELRLFFEQLNQKQPFPLQLVNLSMQRGLLTLNDLKRHFLPSIEQLHDPFLLKGMDLAVDRIVKALESGEKILLYGDYDVDGTSSVALMKLFLGDCGADVPYYVPDRFKEGYGISYEGIDHAVDLGVTLMIALDCGAKAVDKVRYARERGLDMVIVDHHTVGQDAPSCVAMINPKQPDCPYPFKELPACGLALKFAQAIASKMNDGVPDPLSRYADLATLAIASDIVQLTGENRVIASLGLEKIRKNPSAGIAALMALSEQQRSWEIEDLVFFVGPRINSAGRLYSARASVDLLVGSGFEIEQFASDLHAFNQERKGLEDLTTQEAEAMLETQPNSGKTTVLWNPSWNKGIIGIVASRLMERVYRPTILLAESNGKYVGSGRSVVGFDLYKALEACSDHLLQFGGHQYAAGMTLEEDRLESFRNAFEQYAESSLLPQHLEQRLELSGQLSFADITEKFIRQTRLFGPFGPGNMEPVWVAKNVEVRDLRVLKEAHVRFFLAQAGVQIEAIGFGLARRWAQVDSTRIDIAFQPDLKHYRGKTSIQLKIKDFKASESLS